MKNHRFFKPIVCASAISAGRRKDAAAGKLARVFGANFLHRKGMIIRMKKILFAVLFLFCTLSSCAANPSDAGEEKLTVVCTIFPAYDWVRETLGENPANVELILLTENGEELHSFQPSADDFIKIYDCDLFLCVGGESDRWTDRLLVEREKGTIRLLDLLRESVKTEEVIEGMEGGPSEAEDDEHVWLSLSHAKTAVSAIAEKLSAIDPENTAVYEQNASAYRERLDALDSEYRSAAENAEKAAILFGDRFPFRYLTDDYGVAYYAAFPGCSSETEASFETVIFLAEKTDELGLDIILTIEGSDRRIAEAIAQNTKEKKQTILTLDSMQSVTAAEAKNGTTYLSIARENLEVLKKALGAE